MHEPRVKSGLGLGFMVNPHGADHCCNLNDTLYTTDADWRVKELKQQGMPGPLPSDDIGPGKVAVFRFTQLKQLVLDSLVLCMFLPYTLDQITGLVKAVTGWDTSVTELMRVAERTLTVARLFNIREGFSAADDVIPQRFFQPKNDGILADKPLDLVKLEKARRYYYTLMDWDGDTGIPIPEKLEELYIP
jgi:aldehyde:ferredoxin oxidoreductase